MMMTAMMGMTTARTHVRCVSSWRAMMMPPMAMMGAMIIMRMTIMAKICTWVMSFVVRVMRDGVPILSNSCREKPSTCVKTMRRRSRPNPMPTCAEK